MYHTYVDWTLEDPPRPFYVGKGLDERVDLVRRNPRHTAIRKAHGIRREVVLSTDDEQCALDEEKRLIAELKTRGDIPGEWGANFTEGGEGVCGRRHDEKTRQRISQTMKGRPKSLATRMNMRRAQSKKSIVQYALDGTIVARYPSQSEARRATEITNISMCCLRKLKSAGGFVWRYDGDRFDPKTPAVLSDEHRQKLSEAARRRNSGS